MIEYLYKDKIHYFFIKHCYIKNFNIVCDSEIGSNIYIVFHSFVSNEDECFTCYVDDDIDDLQNIQIRRVSDEISHSFI